jgi:[protein-PII] uridylyltransferase
MVDRLVIEAHRELLQASATQGMALLAVGGYGRHHLFPFSDIDLLILFEDEKSAHSSKHIVSPFLQRLWDAGLRVSHSVRTIAECTEIHDRNVELNISLLDNRYLAGDAQLAGKLSDKLARFISGQRQTLIRNLARLTNERHGKYGSTIYHLEPNVKETPGGIRDYQVLCWLTQIKQSDGRRIAPTPLISEVEPARRFLFALRCFLHYQSGRDGNTLTFDLQERAAELAGSPDAAAWMREYYRHTRAVYRLTVNALESAESQPGTSLFTHLLDRRSRLSNADFTVLRERVYLRIPQQVESDPRIVLRLFEFVARHGFRLSQDTRERLSASREQLRDYFRAPEPIYPSLREIFSLTNADLALREMHDTGVLRSVLPELDEIDCLVVRDFYHRFTVDEHTLVTIQTFRALASATDPKAKPFSELLAELERPDLVVLALLFHDAGKADPAERHATASVRLAENAVERLQVPAEDRQMVVFLIDHHLEMSATMTSRDLSEPSAIRAMADIVGTVERLKALTLLTYCDISAVNPGAMTPWRASQLFRLFRLTYHELTRELDADRISFRSSDSPEMAEFLAGFPTRYLRRHTEKEIEEHLQMAKTVAHRGVAVDVRKTSGSYLMTVLTKDRPYLFAPLAGTLSSFGFNILKAEAFGNNRGDALDTFQFADPNRTLELNPTEVDRLIAMIEKIALGKLDVKQLLRNRPVPALPSKGARFQPSVSFDSQASPSATLVQIIAQDRPGLLFNLANAMSAAGCNIEVVLIDTEAHRAIDVFYITTGNRKLMAAELDQLRQQLLAVCQQ